MKTVIRLLGMSVAVAILTGTLQTQAALFDFLTSGGGVYSTGSSLSQVIPDNNASGVAYGLNFADTGLQITDISVTFSTSGGWNGDIYAYLSHGDGLAVLLNRVGATAGSPDGYGTSGFNNITLGLSGADIHTVLTPSSGTAYSADGRLAFVSVDRNNTLSVFSGANPSGSWTLFFADRAGANTATLTGWSVDITAVPEPVNVAMCVFGGLLGVGLLWKRFRGARR